MEFGAEPETTPQGPNASAAAWPGVTYDWQHTPTRLYALREKRYAVSPTLLWAVPGTYSQNGSSPRYSKVMP